MHIETVTHKASLTWAAFKLQVRTPACSRATQVGTNDRDRVTNPGDSEGVRIRFSTEPVVAVNDGGARMAGLHRKITRTICVKNGTNYVSWPTSEPQTSHRLRNSDRDSDTQNKSHLGIQS